MIPKRLTDVGFDLKSKVPRYVLKTANRGMYLVILGKYASSYLLTKCWYIMVVPVRGAPTIKSGGYLFSSLRSSNNNRSGLIRTIKFETFRRLICVPIKDFLYGDKKSFFVARRIENSVLCVKQNLTAVYCIPNSLVWNEVLLQQGCGGGKNARLFDDAGKGQTGEIRVEAPLEPAFFFKNQTGMGSGYSGSI